MEDLYHKPQLKISPHEKAPLFSTNDASVKLKQIIDEFKSGNFSTSMHSEFHELFRQLGFVNLWVFLVLIAGFDGPYNKLTDHLHAEMTNFYQNELHYGAKGACLIGRAHFKSSVFTHGGNTWELLRDPDQSIGLACGVEDRAIEFLGYSIDTFTSNELFKWLYPEYHIPNFSSATGCNQYMLTLPNKQRNRRQPNIKTMTAGGSTAGVHVDLLKLDDIISDKDLDSERRASANMYRMSNWLKSSIRTLVKDWRESRVFLSGTRYSPDDAYEAILMNTKKQVGYWDELPDHYKEDENGEWDVYYRMIREKGRIIFPEAFTEKGLQKLEQEDPWTYWTQYVNNPFKSTFQELNNFHVNECEVDYSPSMGYSVTYWRNGKRVVWHLHDCYVFQVCDPAATDRGQSAKTSRSAHIVMAVSPDGDYFIIRGHADYVPPSGIFEWLFESFLAFKYYIKFTGLEMQGAFRMLKPMLQDEQERRKIGLNLRPIKTEGDKDARIRTNLEPVLKAGKVYSIPSFKDNIMAELKVFPDAPKKDILDALSMAIQEAIIPEQPGKIKQRNFWQKLNRGRVNETTGY